MDLNTLVNFSPLVGLYAELHYTFPFIRSRHYIHEPEIISDIPHRIEPGHKIPILLMIKDANNFPIILKNINISYYLEKTSGQKKTIRAFTNPIWIC